MDFSNDAGTGFTQTMGTVSIIPSSPTDTSPAIVTAGVAAAPPPPPGLVPTPSFGLSRDLLREWLEAEALQHFELDQASRDVAAIPNEAHFAYLDTFDSIVAIFKKLAYDLVTDDY